MKSLEVNNRVLHEICVCLFTFDSQPSREHYNGEDDDGDNDDGDDHGGDMLDDDDDDIDHDFDDGDGDRDTTSILGLFP